MIRGPLYDFSHFIEECNDEKRVRLFDHTAIMRNAREQFNILTFDDLLNFIGNGGLEELQYKETQEFHKIPGTYIDNYTFKTNGVRGYLSLYYQSSTNSWTVKSFHRDANFDTSFAEKLLRAIEPPKRD